MPSVSYNLTTTTGAPPFDVSVRKSGESTDRCTACRALVVGANAEPYIDAGLTKGVSHAMILQVSKSGCGTQTSNFTHCCASTGGSLNCPTTAINVGQRAFNLSGFIGTIAVNWSVSNGATLVNGQSSLDPTFNFPTAGNYTVTATITDECGRSSPIACTVNVQNVSCTLVLAVTGVNC
jgi:hypothetical protein